MLAQTADKFMQAWKRRERERVENLQQQAIVEAQFAIEGKLSDGHNGNTQYRGIVKVSTIVLVMIEYWWRNFKYETIEIIMLIAFLILIVVESAFAVVRVEENAEFLIKFKQLSFIQTKGLNYQIR